jgi:probable F420-dependent oxidoreductase
VNARVRLGVGIPQSFPHGDIDPARIRAYLERAEALGFDSAWTSESIVGGMPILEPVELLTFAAACTERMRLGCAVLLTAVRGPLHLAKSLSTLDHLSRGRLIAGMGLGTPRLDAAFGIDSSSRVARFFEGIQVMKALWTHERASFDGRFWRLDGVLMEPKPVQQPHPPIWIGGSHPAALRRAVRLGDGFIAAGSSSTEQFRGQVKIVRAHLAEAARDPATFPIAKRVYIAVDDDRQRAAAGLSDWFTRNYGRSMHEQVAVWGPADECVARLHEVAEAGAQLIVLSPLFDHDVQLERFAADLAPNLA